MIETGKTSTTKLFVPLSVVVPIAFLTGLAAVLRVLATHNDLWLDEIISLRIAHEVKSLWDIFSNVHIDNNHYLNTVYLYLVRGQSYGPAYRYASVMFGVGLVPAGYWALKERSKYEALIFTGLLAFSYPLIHFSSEARGYSGALLGLVVAYGALIRCTTPEEWPSRAKWGLVYGLALVLALLSQLTSCLIWVPLAAGSLTAMRGPTRRESLRFWIGINLLPASLISALYFFDLSRLTVLGGPTSALTDGVLGLAGWTVEWPATSRFSNWFVMTALAGLVAWQLASLRKSREPAWIVLTLIYTVPPFLVEIMHPVFFSTRYFLVILPFLYIPLAMIMGRFLKTRSGAIAVTVLLSLFLARHMYLYRNFLRVGRGQYSAGLQYMADHTNSPVLQIASNQDFRAGMELSYFAPRVLGSRQLLYVPRDMQAAAQPEWYIVHGDGNRAGPPTLRLPSQPIWYRAAYFGTSDLSGQSWTIYNHQPTH